MTLPFGSVLKAPSENRLTSVQGNGTNLTYQYSPEGTRTTKNLSGVITKIGYDENGRLLWTNYGYGKGTPDDTYFNGRHFGYVVVNSDGSLNSLTYSSVNWLGTDVARFGPTQNLVGRFASLPFGDNQTVLAGTDNDTLHFTGKERDAESGLDYFGARYYASSMGRFMSPDWNDDPVPVPYADLTNPQSLNLYAYVNNNPLSHVDPDGHKCDGGSVGPDGTFTFHCTNDPPPNPSGTLYRLAGGAAMFGEEFGPADWAVVAGLTAAAYLAAHPIHFSLPDNKSATPPVVGPQSTPGNPNQNGKPKLVSNPKHHPNSNSPEPPNAKELYDKAIQDGQGRWWAKDADGTIHGFSAESNGETHWNGSTAGSNPIRMDNIPSEIRSALQ